MTVAELIELLKTFPQDLPVAYRRFSEHFLLEANEVVIGELQPARADGWVHDARPDRPIIPYVVFPGN